MKALFHTNEFPPHIYGGAGVHVEYLTAALARLCEVEVRCFGDQELRQENLVATGYDLDKTGWTAPEGIGSVLGAIQRGLDFNKHETDADIVHLHTWYTHLGGILTKLNYGIPMVLTTHSLEPLRPWKREQLGGGYDCSLWIEKTAIEMADAVIAVSEGTKVDVLNNFDVDPSKIHVIYNGIDTTEYQRKEDPDALRRHGVDPDKPFVLFVGRITRQKGIIHLVDAITHMADDYQIVLCAGAPDTPEIAAEMEAAVAAVSKEREGIVWIGEMIDNPTKISLYSHARAFCSPSIYEPFGIINLEAMACETAVVASAVGGQKEVVIDGETGFLVPVEQQTETPFEATDPKGYARALASKIDTVMGDPELASRMATAGRARAVDTFGWDAIAQQTLDLYHSLV